MSCKDVFRRMKCLALSYVVKSAERYQRLKSKGQQSDIKNKKLYAELVIGCLCQGFQVNRNCNKDTFGTASK